jgi:hypothetical protein
MKGLGWPREHIVLDSPAMMYIGPVEIKLGRRQALEEHNKEPHSRFSKHDALNGGARQGYHHHPETLTKPK